MKLFKQIKQQQTEVKLKRFEELTKGKTKQEIRAIEQQLLKPESEPVCISEKATAKGIDSLTVSIVFRNIKQRDLFEKYFRISHSFTGIHSVPDISMIFDLINQLEKGELVYKKSKRKYIFKKVKTKRRKFK